MKVAYVLHHTGVQASGEQDIKLIGVFSSRETAQSAIDQLRFRAGFRDHRNGFSVDEYPVDKVHWPEGFGEV